VCVGPIAAIAGWLIFRTDRGQPTAASFWFAVGAACLVSFLLGLVATRRIGKASQWSLVSIVLAVTTWLTWLVIFAGTDNS
jgi:hypothetical protein